MNRHQRRAQKHSNKNWAEAYSEEPGSEWEKMLAVAGCTGSNIERLRPKNTTPALEAAMALAIFRGWKVFPARMEDGKKWSWLSAEYAGGENWGMTSDPQQLLRNFTDRRCRLLCGVGVPTGWVNGIFVVEADTKAGHDVDGTGNLAALEAKHGKLPDTLMAESPSGSVHRYFKHPGRGIKIGDPKGGEKKIAPGVDVKGDGGMVIAPPSVAPESMRCPGPYVWLNDLPIADAPQWLLNLICEQGNSDKRSNSSGDGEKNWAEQYGDEVRGKIPLDKLTFMLMKVIPNTAESGRKHWIKVLHALKHERPDDDGLQLWQQYSHKYDGPLEQKYVNNPQLYEKFIIKTWRGAKPDRITGGSLYHLADQADPDWRDKYEAAKPEQEQDEVGEVSIKPYDFPDEETLERYDWLLGRHLLRGEVAGSVAPGGTGKSSQSIVEALAMASGKQLTHDTVPAHPLRVVLINLEDKRNTMDKRIAAAMKLHKLKKEDIGDRLIVLAKGDIKIKIAKQLHTGSVARSEKTIAALTNLMIEHKADVLSIDSFIRTHSVGENDNSAIQEVVECFEDIAAAANCGVHLWHHTRKGDGEGATVELSRGAKAFIDACRSVRVFETMTEKQGEKLKVENHRQYFRVFSGKRNFAPHVENSNWYHIESVQLMNGPPNYTLEGDNIGAIERWELPTISEPTSNDIAKIEEAIKGGQWREDVRATMWVGKAIASVLNLDPDTQKEQIKSLIKKLLRVRAVAGKTSDRKDCIFIVPEVDEGAPVA